MKPYYPILLLICLPNFLFAQAQVTLDYINKYKGIAIKEMKRTGIPASITLAQAIVESGSGESILAKQANNHFGIKCKTEWTGEKMYKDDDAKNECFRVYPNAESSFIDHSNFIKNRPYYAALFELDPVDDTAWAYGLKKAGYATEKDYPNSLLKVIDLYELAQYNFPELVAEDSIALLKETGNSVLPPNAINTKKITTIDTLKKDDKHTDALQFTAPTKDTVIKIVKVTDTVVKIVVVKDTVIQRINTKDSVLKSNESKKDSVQDLINKESNSNTLAPSKEKITKKQIQYPLNQKFKINGVSAIWANAGRSFLEIANTYNIPVYKLYVNNELEETDLVQNDQILYLGEKKKESGKKVHIAQSVEKFYEIAQMEGIQLTLLKAYNANLSENEIKEGTIVYLFNRPKDPIKELVPEKNKTLTPPKSVEKNSNNTTPKKNKFKLF